MKRGVIACHKRGMSIVIGFVAEAGDIGCFIDSKQIKKLVGLDNRKEKLFRKKDNRGSVRGAKENCRG